MKAIWIEAEGRGTWVQGQWVAGRLWVHLNGETRVLEPEVKTYGQGKSGQAKADIAAPMPGKVTKLLVKDGEAVSVGQVLAVMEAMKMEYSLKAEQAGTVKTVECKVGDQVALGKVLVRIEPEKT